MPRLEVAAGLSVIDLWTVSDYCCCIGRLQVIERRISLEGAAVQGRQSLLVRHPLLSAANQYRSAARMLLAELGLSPSSRGLVPPSGDDEDDDAFD